MNRSKRPGNSIWKAIPLPDQVKRLLIVFVVVLTAFLLVRSRFVPDEFGKYGHYRPAATEEIMALDISYAGHRACLECHDDIEGMKSVGRHRNVACESCHGPSQEHITSDAEALPLVPRKREFCVQCHIYNPAKPTGFPQIDQITHNPGKQCILCHRPHAPQTPTDINECSACHTSIARTKTLSPHAPLSCEECHVVPAGHKINPRAELPSIPSSRADCGKCHDRHSDRDSFIPRIDLEKHEKDFLCWQCHYPHFPEVK